MNAHTQLSPLAEACADVMAYRRKRTWDQSHFIVYRDFGTLGIESITKPDMTRESLIADIASGQIEDVCAIFELNPVEGWSSDITSDVLDAAEAIVSEQRRREEYIGDPNKQHRTVSAA